MKSSIRFLSSLIGIVFIAACASTPGTFNTPNSHTERAEASGAWVNFQMQRRLPVDATELPWDGYIKAERQRAGMAQYSTRFGAFINRDNRAKAGAARWEELGPHNFAGRARTLVFDPRNANRMLSGGVSGGVWESLDAGLSWRPLSDTAANINIGALLIDPVTPEVIYAGTGELYRYSDQPYSSMFGMGILRSTDGGRSFQQLLATASSDFRYVADLAISLHDHRRLYAATNSGIWLSRDGGASFTQVLRPVDAVGNLQYEGCNDVQILADDTHDVLLAACSSRSMDDRYWLPNTVTPSACGSPCPAALFRNDDAAGNGIWQQVLTEPGMGRTQMDASKSDPDVVYAVAASIVPGYDRDGDGSGDYDNGLHAVWRSNDGGETWQAQLRNSSSNALSTYLFSYADGFDGKRCGFEVFHYSAGWYNMAIAVDPVNPEVVWIAGMEHYRSDDGGRSFGKASYHWLFRQSGYGVHADQHFLRFHPDYDGINQRQLFSTNDGGITVTDNALAPTRRDFMAACGPVEGMVSWRELTAGLGTIQFYTGTASKNGDVWFGGAQDNGTLLGRNGLGSSGWNHINGGDGAHVALDPRNSNVLYASSQNIALRRSMNGGLSFTDASSGINDQSIFIAPYLLDPSAPDRLYLGGTRLWRTDNQGRSWRAASAKLGPTFGHRISAIAVAPTNPNRFLIGNQVGIYRSSTATNSTANTVWPSVTPRSGWVSSLGFDPVNANIAYATYSSFGGQHVWRSTDGGETWVAIDGSGSGRLPDVPVHSLVVDPNNRERLFIASDVGVFVSIDAGMSWASENAGFANAITEALTIAPGDAEHPPQLFAFTYGRGAWRVPLADLDGIASYKIDSDISGMFYDPSQSGHGLMIENIIADGVSSLLVSWFTYLDGKQRWLFGSGAIDGNQARINLAISSGADFPPYFMPETASFASWGELVLTFADADNGTAEWTSHSPGFNNGSMPLRRLTQLASGAEITHNRVAPCHSGAWYDPAQSGHGLYVEVLGDPQNRSMLAVWYAYLNGEQVWMLGTGPITGNVAELQAIITYGAGFPPAFNPADVVRQAWGSMRFTAYDDQHGLWEWNSTVAGFGSGSMSVSRLTTLRGHECAEHF